MKKFLNKIFISIIAVLFISITAINTFIFSIDLKNVIIISKNIPIVAAFLKSSVVTISLLHVLPLFLVFTYLILCDKIKIKGKKRKGEKGEVKKDNTKYVNYLDGQK